MFVGILIFRYPHIYVFDIIGIHIFLLFYFSDKCKHKSESIHPKICKTVFNGWWIELGNSRWHFNQLKKKKFNFITFVKSISLPFSISELQYNIPNWIDPYHSKFSCTLQLHQTYELGISIDRKHCIEGTHCIVWFFEGRNQ